MEKTEAKDVKKKVERSYERGFSAKCAEYGIDPEELLDSMLTGDFSKTASGIEKAAQGVVPTNPATQPKRSGQVTYQPGQSSMWDFGNLNAGYDKTMQQMGSHGSGSVWDAGMFRAIGNAGRNVGTFFHNAGQGAQELWGGRPAQRQNYLGATEDPTNRMPQQKQISAETWNSWDPQQQQRALESGRTADWQGLQKLRAAEYEKDFNERQKGYNASGGNMLTNRTPMSMMI